MLSTMMTESLQHQAHWQPGLAPDERGTAEAVAGAHRAADECSTGWAWGRTGALGCRLARCRISPTLRPSQLSAADGERSPAARCLRCPACAGWIYVLQHSQSSWTEYGGSAGRTIVGRPVWGDGHTDAHRGGKGHDEADSPRQEGFIRHHVRCSRASSATGAVKGSQEQCHSRRAWREHRQAYLDARNSDGAKQEPAAACKSAPAHGTVTTAQ